MCNLYSITRAQEAMRRFFRVKRDLTGNLPVPPAVYPDMMAPVVRTAPDGERELIMMRWGFPPPPNLDNAKPRAYLGIRRRFARASWVPQRFHRMAGTAIREQSRMLSESM
jgi:putative SOS response-associated peptidase YedK